MNKVVTVSLLLVSILCGCSDKPAPIQTSATSTAGQSDGTVESLLASVAGITNGQTAFKLFVPSELTFKGESIPMDAAMAIVGDSILGHDLFPAGYEEQKGGRSYNYRKLGQ